MTYVMWWQIPHEKVHSKHKYYYPDFWMCILKKNKIICFPFFLFAMYKDWFMVFNATFNNISVILWRSVKLVEETGVPGENHHPVASHWQTLSDNLVTLCDKVCQWLATGRWQTFSHKETILNETYIFYCYSDLKIKNK
jgi:hypothetical protein